jgi:predicted Zn-dependent protease
MGRAYSGIAAMHANLGNREQAETYYRLALSHLDRMSEREKYRTRGGYYLFTRNDAKAVEEFSALLRHYPADTAGGTNLAYAHFNLREMGRAVEEGRKPVDIMPKNVLYRNNLALYAMYAGDFDTALKEAHEVLEGNPSFMKAYLAVAVAAAGQEKLENAKAAYAKMAGISKRGASLSAVGAADLALYRGDAAGAIAILEKAVAVDLEADNRNAAARKQTMLAEAELLAGNRRRALATAHAATETSNSDAILYSAARVLIAAGDYSAAAELADRLRRKIQAEPQMYASLLDGESLLVQEKPRKALERVKAAQGLADSWMGRFLLARAYCHLGAFAEAHSELEVAIQRRGEATALLLDDVPTVRLLPLLDYELGCISEGLRSPAAKAAFERFLRARSEAKDDPLVIDAKRRLGLA